MQASHACNAYALAAMPLQSFRPCALQMWTAHLVPDVDRLSGGRRGPTIWEPMWNLQGDGVALTSRVTRAATSHGARLPRLLTRGMGAYCGKCHLGVGAYSGNSNITRRGCLLRQ